MSRRNEQRRAEEQRRRDLVLRRLAWANGRTEQQINASLEWPIGAGAVLRELARDGLAHERDGRWFRGPRPRVVIDRDTIVAHLATHGGARVEVLARALGASTGELSNMLAELRAEGLVTTSGAARGTVYTLSSSAPVEEPLVPEGGGSPAADDPVQAAPPDQAPPAGPPEEPALHEALDRLVAAFGRPVWGTAREHGPIAARLDAIRAEVEAEVGRYAAAERAITEAGFGPDPDGEEDVADRIRELARQRKAALESISDLSEQNVVLTEQTRARSVDPAPIEAAIDVWLDGLRPEQRVFSRHDLVALRTRLERL